MTTSAPWREGRPPRRLPKILTQPKLKRQRDALIDSLDMSKTTMLVSTEDPTQKIIVHRTTRAGPGLVQVSYIDGEVPRGHFFAKTAAEVVKRAWTRLGPLRKEQEA